MCPDFNGHDSLRAFKGRSESLKERDETHKEGNVDKPVSQRGWPLPCPEAHMLLSSTSKHEQCGTKEEDGANCQGDSLNRIAYQFHHAVIVEPLERCACIVIELSRTRQLVSTVLASSPSVCPAQQINNVANFRKEREGGNACRFPSCVYEDLWRD